MNETLPPLPKDWINRIFIKLKITYGPALMAGVWGDDLEDVVLGWADELATFRNHPDAIKYALDNLPADYPPNLIQFKESCREGLRQATIKYPALTSKSEKMPEDIRRQIFALVNSKTIN